MPRPTLIDWPPPSCAGRLALDIGCNTGRDTVALLRAGLCVLAVDANPLMVEAARKRVSNLGSPAKRGGAKVLNFGLEERDGNATFYLTKMSIHSSFDRRKALKEGRRYGAVNETIIPTYRCESLWSRHLGPADADGPRIGRPYWMKIDIEERHHVCVDAVTRLPQGQRPWYVSWEMHEMAKGLAYPLLDTSLLVSMYHAGYRRMKLVSQNAVAPSSSSSTSSTSVARVGKSGGGAFSGGLLPPDVIDGPSNSSAWQSVAEALKRGLAPPIRDAGVYDWWDFYMALDDAPVSPAAPPAKGAGV